MGQTAIEKIMTRYAVGLGEGEKVHAGDFVTMRPKHIMTHDNTGAVIPKFKSIGATKIFDPEQPVFGVDHDIQNHSPENIGKYAKIEAFANEHGVDFHKPGRGIVHQIMIEEGYVTPGSLCVGSDSHSNIYGAIGAVGTPVVRTDAAALWATGQTWWQLPPMARVTLTGKLNEGVTGKDVIITLCGLFNNDEVLNHAVEFVGDGVASLSVEERLTISNMTTEWGVLVGMFPFDQTLKDWLLERAESFAGREHPRYSAADIEQWWSKRGESSADDDAFYAVEITLDLSTVSPYISGPNSVKVMRSAHEVMGEKTKVHRAYLLSCVNARLSDFESAAAVMTNPDGSVRPVAEGVKFYIAPASTIVKARAVKLGYWDTLLAAGAIELPPGCGACIGLGEGTLEGGEVGISATNRNFQGRMGSRDALCYLGSPAVVAESAARGYISAPIDMSQEPVGTCTINTKISAAASAQAIIDGFPQAVEGRTLYLPENNLNTDGIYGKDVTYRDDITPEQQGQYAMLNYDPEFQNIAQIGDIIVGARNFGSGSSREQAATALASRGIQLVICATASQTYKRNAFNISVSNNNSVISFCFVSVIF
jgi:homoaconitate hydratase